jgi:(E)-4-hydroxy-3-methylbut-2-enyl-diphosphate synthase
VRRNTIPVKVGSVIIGGEAPVSIQSMTNTDTSDLGATLQQINQLVTAGCELIRLAVTNEDDARALGIIKKRITVPLIADIQFDYNLALLSMEYGADKIRINPGNIGGTEKLTRVIEKAKKMGIPLRIGVNSGSVSKELRAKYDTMNADLLVESTLQAIQAVEKHSFSNFIISLKATDVSTAIEAYERISDLTSYPLHLGITEAGRGLKGIVKSTLGIGSLLLKGIGDTIRVSLTGDPVEEVVVAKEILQAAGLRQFGPEIISCPTCARCKIDLDGLLNQVENIVKDINYPLKIAVMGCPVNGPGEAKEADIGISGSRDGGIIFKEGKVFKKVALDKLVDVFKEEMLAIVKKDE